MVLEKQLYCNIFNGALIKKYKLKTNAAEHFGFHWKFKDKSNTLQTRSTKTQVLLSERFRQEMTTVEFFQEKSKL